MLSHIEIRSVLTLLEDERAFSRGSEGHYHKVPSDKAQALPGYASGGYLGPCLLSLPSSC
jgi:hypothetical protein